MPRIVFTPAQDNPPVDINTVFSTPGFYAATPDGIPSLLSFGNNAFVLALAPDGTIGTFFTPNIPPDGTQFYLRRGTGNFNP